MNDQTRFGACEVRFLLPDIRLERSECTVLALAPRRDRECQAGINQHSFFEFLNQIWAKVSLIVTLQESGHSDSADGIRRLLDWQLRHPTQELFK